LNEQEGMSMRSMMVQSTASAGSFVAKCLARAIALVGLIGPFLAAPAQSGQFHPQRLAAIAPRMQKFVDEGVVAGVVTVVGNSQGVAHHEAVGWQDIESRRPMTKGALFRIASMTKPITAIGILQLHEAGKLSIEDPVEKHLPEFQGQMLVERREEGRVILKRPTRPITIRDLLTHTSGLPGGFPPGLADLYFRRHYSLAEATCIQSQRPLEFEPGSRWAYCNAGIDTLGRIIEVVSGQSYEDYLAQHVFRPLGMVDTTFYPTEQQLDRLATMYAQREGKLVPAGYVLVGPPQRARHPIPAAGLFSTGSDLARLYQALLLQGRLGEVRILRPESVALMTQVHTGQLVTGFTPGMGFGLGWGVIREPQGVHAMLSPGTFGHGGAFGTQGWIDPHKDLFVILLIQRTGLPNSDASDLRRELQQLAVDALSP
jgi:CubicO group peptidase (beta-lactamase class C family)